MDIQKSKKAAELSLNVIIVSVLVLIVLVVLIVIFSGRMGSFVTNIENCESKGGVTSATSTKEGYACYSMVRSEGTNNYCCIPVTSK